MNKTIKTSPRIINPSKFTISESARTRILQVVVWGGLLILWEIFGRTQSPYLFTYPSAIIKAGARMLADGELVHALGISLKALFLGFGLSAATGVLVGLVAGRYNYLKRLLDPIMVAFYVTPRVALIPFIIVWFGIGFSAKLSVIWLTSFFIIYFNVVKGVSSVSGSYVDVARAYGATENIVLKDVILPAILPFIATGLRLGLGLSLIGMVVSEFFIGITGLGGLIMIYALRFKIAEVFVVTFVILILGVILMNLATILEKRLSHWRKTERAFR